ncbi:NUDIX hydrolase domain-like protein [Choanephora cucurbitarum]|nr:NUDIX hydrolase domain-like protein [Choanephora cucurbitarum]
MTERILDSPPPEEQLSTTQIEYTKKARHGHGKDVTDSHNVRQVAGCLPIDPVSKRVILISSSKNPDNWVIPKGGWETDETQEHAALRETWEESGIKGRIIRHLGTFVERKKKKVKAHHWIYELQIDEIVKKYPERKKRDRRWFTYEEALIATKNNRYIQDAIRLSSIRPHYQNSQINYTIKEQQQAKNETEQVDIAENSAEDSTQEDDDTGERPREAFRALQNLMKGTPVS